MQKDIKRTQKILTVSTAVVALLLLLNLLVWCFLIERSTDTADADGNVIGDTQAAALPTPPTRDTGLHVRPVPMRLLAAGASEKISLNFLNGYENEKAFRLTNMLPGDSTTKEYKVTVRSRSATSLAFSAEVSETSLLLSGEHGLVFTVTANGEPLYEGRLADMPTLSTPLKTGISPQEVIYRITAQLPTVANNAYANQSLSISFLWSLSETGAAPVEPDDPYFPEDPNPFETTSEPMETTIEPEETSQEPEETSQEPPEITTDPDETSPEFPGGFETDPAAPLVPEGCKKCAVDLALEKLFHSKRDRCAICDTVVSLFFADKTACICPLGCLLVLLLLLWLLLFIVFLVVYCVYRKLREEKALREAARKLPPDDSEL